MSVLNHILTAEALTNEVEKYRNSELFCMHMFQYIINTLNIYFLLMYVCFTYSYICPSILLIYSIYIYINFRLYIFILKILEGNNYSKIIMEYLLYPRNCAWVWEYKYWKDTICAFKELITKSVRCVTSSIGQQR